MALARHYKVSEIKQKLLHPAQTSVYSVEVLTNSAVNNFVDVSLISDQEAFNLSCCEASLPGSNLATHEVNNDYHGSTEKMAYRKMFDDTIDLTFYVDYRYATLKYFLGWISFIVGEGSYFGQDEYLDPTTFYRMTYPSSYKTNINILKFEKDISSKNPKYKLGYTFVGAFPISLTSIPVSYDESQLLKVTVSFSYQRYVVNSAFNPYKGSGVLGNPGNAFNPLQQAQSNSNVFGPNVGSTIESAQSNYAFGPGGSYTDFTNLSQLDLGFNINPIQSVGSNPANSIGDFGTPGTFDLA